MIGDIIGDMLTGKIKDGLSNMFAPGGSGSGGGVQINLPSTSATDMALLTSTPPGQAESVDTSDPEVNLMSWQRRLFQSENAYAIKIGGRAE